MQILQEDHYFYTLSRDETTDEYFLEATCGRSAVFTITIKLTPKEVAGYHAEPESVRVLAQDIVDSPDDFLSRRV